MQRFPCFLRAMPTFFGFDPQDLAILMLFMHAFQLLDVDPLTSILTSLGLIALYKIAAKRLDVVGLLHRPKKKTLSWIDELKERGL